MFIIKEISRFPFQVFATPTRTLIKAKFDYHSLSCFVQRVFYLVEYLLWIPTIFLLSPNTPQCIVSNAPLILATSCDFFLLMVKLQKQTFFFRADINIIKRIYPYTLHPKIFNVGIISYFPNLLIELIMWISIVDIDWNKLFAHFARL